MLTLIIAAVLLLSFAVYYLVLWEPRKVRYRRHDISFHTLPRQFDGFRILHLTDLHFKARDESKKDALKALTQEPYDLCLITGDFIEDGAAIEACCEALKALKPLCGTFAVLGNHDYYRYSYVDAFRNRAITDRPNCTQELIDALSAAGINVLRNESVEITKNGARIYLVGVDDEVTCHADVSLALHSVPKDEATLLILLSHTPDIVKSSSIAQEYLLLAGHTHGGQVALPFWGPLVNHSKLKDGFVSGMARLGHGVIVVSSGVGVNRLFPFRLRCRPEILMITLRCEKNKKVVDEEKKQ